MMDNWVTIEYAVEILDGRMRGRMQTITSNLGQCRLGLYVILIKR